MKNVETIERGRWYPEMPPSLPGEDDGAYTDRLTGADGTDRRPYDHKRNRQCSIGYHDECSDPKGEVCKCPCHTEVVDVEAQLREAAKAFVGTPHEALLIEAADTLHHLTGARDTMQKIADTMFDNFARLAEENAMREEKKKGAKK